MTTNRENAARRYANERALKIEKSRKTGQFQIVRRPDVHAFTLPAGKRVPVDALDYLRGQLAEADPDKFGRYLAPGAIETGYPLTLDEVEAILDGPAVTTAEGYRCTSAPHVDEKPRTVWSRDGQWAFGIAACGYGKNATHLPTGRTIEYPASLTTLRAMAASGELLALLTAGADA